MRVWLAIVASVALIATAVLYASELQRSTAEQHFREAEVATRVRSSLLDGELALDQALAGLGRQRLPAIDQARARLATALSDARAVAANDPVERRHIAEQEQAAADWNRAASSEIAFVRAGHTNADRVLDDRLAPIARFLSANDRFQARLDVNRHDETARAALVPVGITVVLSAIFVLAGALFRRRSRRTRRHAQAEDEARRENEERFQETQRRLGEALQVAADQPEAHRLLSRHLRLNIPGAAIHILNRNNSADRLEPSEAVPEDSPLSEPLITSRPRSCIAVRLSRPFERGPDSREVLGCDVCGGLPGESSCRPLLVGGEVIGSVLIERPGGLGEDETRRVEESVSAAAPVLANLRNLAIAEMRAATDALTGLPNRRSVDDSSKRMLAQANRSMQPLAVLTLDLDHFKQINDTFGHERGDDALAGFGALLRAQLRTSDFAGRSGGEEFVVLLPDTDRQGALRLAEKLRRTVHSMRVQGVDRRITVSGGLAVFPDDASDVETIMRLADRALYTAKQHGRDRIETVSAAASANGSDPVPAPAA